VRFVRVRLVKVSHPNPKSTVRRNMYYVLENYAVETPFGYVMLSDEAFRKLLQLDERAKAEVGRSVLAYMDVYMPADELLRILRQALASAEPGTSRYLAIREAIRAIESGAPGIALGVRA